MTVDGDLWRQDAVDVDFLILSMPRREGLQVGPFSTFGQSAPSDAPQILGIWRLGESIHASDFARLAFAQPADSPHNPRFDYVIKYAVDAESDAESQRQIEQAVAVAGEVSHPNLIPVLDGTVTGMTPYIVMPYIRGETLERRRVATGPVALPVTLWFTRQIAQAAEILHRGGWIHGDIKPANIVVTDQGHVTLIDLGFASRIHAPLGRLFRGTPDYASPELRRGGTAALPAMDVYAIGCLLRESVDTAVGGKGRSAAGISDLVDAMTQPAPDQRPPIDRVVQSLLRLEIETLGRHIEPITPRRRAA